MSAVLVNGYLLMIGGAFTILISQSLGLLLGISEDAQFYVPFAIGGILLLLSLVDDMIIIAKMSSIGVFASVVYAISISAAGAQASGFDHDPALTYAFMLPLKDLTIIGAVICVMLVGFTYQKVAPTVRVEMEKPREPPKAIIGAVLVVMCVYAAAGGIAYYGFGNDVKCNVNQSMVDQDGKVLIWGNILSVATIANLCVIFRIVMNIVYRAAEAGINVKIPVLHEKEQSTCARPQESSRRRRRPSCTSRTTRGDHLRPIRWTRSRSMWWASITRTTNGVTRSCRMPPAQPIAFYTSPRSSTTSSASLKAS